MSLRMLIPIRPWALAVVAAASFAAAGALRPAIGDDCCGGDKKKDAGAETKPATEATKPAAAAETGELLVDLGNAKCPVMGGKVNGKTFSEWNGLRVGHCCPMCVAKFGKDPAAYLKTAGIEWRAAAEALKKVNDAKGADRDKALAALKAKWTVVREPAAAPAPKGTLVDLANAKCPVAGEDVDGSTWSEWNGLRVGFCCPDCTSKFTASPEKVLDDAKIEWRPAAEAVKLADAAKGDAHRKALDALAKKWTVVREADADAPAPTK